MDAGLRIVRYPYEEPHHVNLVVTASNGRSTAELEIYANADDLREYGTALQEFPLSATHSVLWELGSEQPEERFAFHFRLKFVVTEMTGQCAVVVRFNNNEPLPDTEISAFCIPTEPARLNRLGQQLLRFGKLEEKELVWIA